MSKINKIKSVKEFIEKVDTSKKANPKDLSSDQDLTIAIMNLISIEEHLLFSGAKTEKNSFYDMVQDIRTMRGNLMLQIIPEYQGEVWCTSKHLLAASMRLFEVGTKQQSMGRNEKAYELFNQAYELYCMFWGLNMGLVDTKDVKWVDDNVLPINTTKIETKSAKSETIKNEKSSSSMMSKMKNFVKKAVDCCIE
ncbi:MAG: hypothetical protein LBU68_02465 [Rickettsiales bacterium]|jgi:hypothetical protein|nr:hypothetical protein [Rickettsiales bacterium]